MSATRPPRPVDESSVNFCGSRLQHSLLAFGSKASPGPRRAHRRPGRITKQCGSVAARACQINVRARIFRRANWQNYQHGHGKMVWKKACRPNFLGFEAG